MEGTTPVIAAIEAPLMYLVPTDEVLFSYNYPPPPGVPMRNGRYEARRVTVRNGRALADRPSLEREGFALRREPSAVANFYDEAEVKRVYYPEVERLLMAATGAAKVVIFDHTLRNTATDKQLAGQVRGPANRVHNDYTERSAPQRVRDLLAPEEAASRLERRYAEVNVWRPIKGPVKSAPLALCDAGSLDPADLVVSELRYPDRTGEIYLVTYNPRHRWFYFPEMSADETVLIKCFDSARDGRARISVHTAFADPATPSDAPARESIEVRAFLFF
ncbi:MAG TPA: CmcJ/NvfI family oxidoreductase [Stellaceae bacterium]|nr:CmcJ/NvfI family oxidoreductase [Stellaceae bacterium]